MLVYQRVQLTSPQLTLTQTLRGPGSGVSWTKVGDWPQHPDLSGGCHPVIPPFTLNIPPETMASVGILRMEFCKNPQPYGSMTGPPK